MELIGEIIYFTLSSLVMLLVFTSAFLAHFAMKRGITYETLKATVWALTFSAIAHVWHALTSHFLLLSLYFGEAPELIEYAIYIIGYAMFLKIIWKSLMVKMPE